MTDKSTEPSTAVCTCGHDKGHHPVRATYCITGHCGCKGYEPAIHVIPEPSAADRAAGAEVSKWVCCNASSDTVDALAAIIAKHMAAERERARRLEEALQMAYEWEKDCPISGAACPKCQWKKKARAVLGGKGD